MIDLRKTNYLLIIINIILMIVLVSGAIYFNSKLNSNTVLNSKRNQSIEVNDKQTSAVESKVTIENYQSKHDEFTSIVEAGNLNACNSLDESFFAKCKDSIYLNQAIEYSSPDLCKKISIEAMKMACKDLLLFN